MAFLFVEDRVAGFEFLEPEIGPLGHPSCHRDGAYQRRCDLCSFAVLAALAGKPEIESVAVGGKPLAVALSSKCFHAHELGPLEVFCRFHELNRILSA